MSKDKILIIGSSGQIGTELHDALKKSYGADQVIASDIRKPASFEGIFEQLDVLDEKRLFEIVKNHQVNQIYLLAALLSATSEKDPAFAWKLNMSSLFSVLNLAKEKKIQKVYWPSSIAVFGPTTPKENVPQKTIMEPNTVYGISKLAGERWCEYYHQKFGVDVRSIRYPGLISYKTAPGGGTTDYAVDIFFQALKSGNYRCFLSENTKLPMMYMEDAIRGTLELMSAPANQLSVRSSYNFSAFSFTPAVIADEIRKSIPEFSISYQPDFRQAIADSWPGSIDDSQAREDWGWKPAFNLEQMTREMLSQLGQAIEKRW